MLRQRRDLTEGARKAAEASLAAADRRAEEYEAKLRDARALVYKDQEETRRGWLEQQATQVASSRQSAETTVRMAKDAIAAEVSSARQTLERTSVSLADQIATALLARKA
jgi:F-type H+-transporting ATPase subunit b